jgi:hypothetical protein
MNNKVLTFCLLFFIKSTIFSQNLIFRKDSKKIDSILQNHKNKQKKEWLNFLPNFNYDIKNNSVNIGFSLSSFSNFYQQKQRNQIELEKLRQILISNSENKIKIYNSKIIDFNFQIKILENKIEVFKIEKKLFEISEGKYKNNEITTEDFLKLKKSFLININNLKTELHRSKKISNEINQQRKNKEIKNSIINLEIKILRLLKI